MIVAVGNSPPRGHHSLSHNLLQETPHYQKEGRYAIRVSEIFLRIRVLCVSFAQSDFNIPDFLICQGSADRSMKLQ